MLINKLIRTTAAVAASATLGSIASSETSSKWYRKLEKPPFQPPPAVFPVVWTALYGDIAASSAVVLDRTRNGSNEGKGFRGALILNLLLNTAWTWVFFKAHRLGPAVAVAGALTTSTGDLARRAGKVERGAGWALVPYALWCAFATVLSAAIWRRNR